MNRVLPAALLLVGCGPDPHLRDGRDLWWTPLADCAPTTFYEDLDGDGYGAAGTAVEGETCRPPDRHAEQPGDCDDRASSVHPNAPELCDDRDNDCDGLVDDDDDTIHGGYVWYKDDDADGYGDDTVEVASASCVGPPRSARLGGDCNDTNSAMHPGRSEDLTDGIDNDCDGLVDLRGTLDATWTIAKSGGLPAPEDRDCEVVWSVHGLWDAALCPDCTLSFWSDATAMDGAVPADCGFPYPDTFGLHVLASPEDTLYLGISVLYEGETYYDYYYGYSTSPDYLVLHTLPEVPVSWDGTHLSFQHGIHEVLYEVGDEPLYFTDSWTFSGTVE